MPNSGELSFNGDPRSSSDQSNLQFLNLSPAAEQPVVIQTRKGPYALEPELAGLIPRRARWRGGSLNPTWRACLLLIPTLICLFQLVSGLPNFFLASAPSTAFDTVPARMLEFGPETSMSGSICAIVDYSYKNVHYREAIFSHPQAIQYLGKEVKIQLHPLFPSWPQAEQLGQEAPFDLGFKHCHIPALLFVILCVFWSIGVWAPLRRLSLVKLGLPFCATVTGKTEAGGRRHRYEAEYSYQLGKAEETYTHYQGMSEVRWKALQIGDRATVLCNPIKTNEVVVYALCEWKAFRL